jgi:hypothetical protein
MPWFGAVRDIHMGTSWDYIKFKDKSTKSLLGQLAAGLIQLASEIEKGILSDKILFRGNSHFLSEATLKKLRFSYRDPNIIENFLFFLTYLEDCLLRSLSAKRFILLPYKNNKIVYIRGEDLLRVKRILIRIYQSLSDYSTQSQPTQSEIEEKKELINVA